MPVTFFSTALALALLGPACALAQAMTDDSLSLKSAAEVSSAPSETSVAAPILAAPSVVAPFLAAPRSEEVKDSLRAIPTIDLTAVPADLWERIRNGFAMPNLTSKLVQDRQIWYAARPSYVKRMVERSQRYLYHIVEELEKRGMPTELALLPMVESAFNPMAYSRAHASGLWQFIPSTGKTYKLQQNSWYDGRRDVVASTSAALDYLQFLYEMHGDWHLALASYNWGENAVARAIEKNKAKGLPTDYLSLTMPNETRYYVPKLQALKNIVANPHAFNVDLDPVANQPYFITVQGTGDIDVRLAARLADMPLEEFLALNPGNNRPVIIASAASSLVLPADKAELFQANLGGHDKPLVSWQNYTLRQGDKLDAIAAKHGIPVARLKEVNGIGRRTKVAPGYQLMLPLKGASIEPLPAMFQPPAVPETRMVVRKLAYTVQRGDTLPGIAQRFNVSSDDLRRWNKIGRLTPGQKLVIQVRQATPGKITRAASKQAKRGVKQKKKS